MLKKITSIALSLIVAFAAIMAIKPAAVHAEGGTEESSPVSISDDDITIDGTNLRVKVEGDYSQVRAMDIFYTMNSDGYGAEYSASTDMSGNNTHDTWAQVFVGADGSKVTFTFKSIKLYSDTDKKNLVKSFDITSEKKITIDRTYASIDYQYATGSNDPTAAKVTISSLWTGSENFSLSFYDQNRQLIQTYDNAFERNAFDAKGNKTIDISDFVTSHVAAGGTYHAQITYGGQTYTPRSGSEITLNPTQKLYASGTITDVFKKNMSFQNMTNQGVPVSVTLNQDKGSYLNLNPGNGKDSIRLIKDGTSNTYTGTIVSNDANNHAYDGSYDTGKFTISDSAGEKIQLTSPFNYSSFTIDTIAPKITTVTVTDNGIGKKLTITTDEVIYGKSFESNLYSDDSFDIGYSLNGTVVNDGYMMKDYPFDNNNPKYSNTFTRNGEYTDFETLSDDSVIDAAGNPLNTEALQNVSFTIDRNINNFTISDIPDQTYSGADLKPVSLADGENTLKQGTDYTVKYSNNHNVGTATAVITGIGDYTGSVTKTFVIKPKEVSVSGIKAKNKVYDGTTTALLDTSAVVIEGIVGHDDVSVNASGSFEDADAGDDKTVNFTQELVGNAAGNYVLNSGTGTVTADITKANPLLSVEAISAKTYSDEDFQLNATHKGDGVISYSSDNTNVLTVSDSGVVHIAGAGTASITVNLAESKNYNSASDTLKITVNKANGNIRIQNAVINKTYGDDDFSVKPSDSTPGTIRYKADDSGVVSVDENGMVHILKAGTAVVTVAMEATDNHHAVSETITINVAEAAPETPAPIIDDKDYVITAGNKTSWQRGSNKQLVIISNGDYDLFNGLYMDGSLVDRSDYEVKKGSTEIYLQPSYLETLTTGRHTFELRYSNGKKASGEFTITEAEKPAEEKKDNKTAVPSEHSNDNKTVTTSSPKTGDNTNSVAWGLIMIAAIICAAVVSAIKKKRMN